MVRGRGTPRALLVDLDGVVRRWPSRDAALESAHALPVGAIRAVAFASPLLEEAITGRTDDARWRETIVRRLLARHPDADARAAVAEWSRSPGEVDGATLGVLRAARATARLILVTNATSRLRDDLVALDLIDEFDAVVSSSEVGVAKPAPGIYRAALAAAAVEPRRALFVDDSEENVRGATALGVEGYRFGDAAELSRLLAARGLPTA